MIYKFIISPRAVKQRDKIIMWYEGRSRQAADNFIKELDETSQKQPAFCPFHRITANYQFYR
ncbi:MAG: hypothetical protein LBE82_08030 [Chitinophagaceae bacterium]|jgi:plasmid stabilization system protein ParE|nr:hypothetical protein [Chitinophagaceae bacterium]